MIPQLINKDNWIYVIFPICMIYSFCCFLKKFPMLPKNVSFLLIECSALKFREGFRGNLRAELSEALLR